MPGDLPQSHDPGREETAQERADRNFGELLQEVRVAQTGVQILFAFLLTLPFATRFTVMQPRDRAVYVVTLLASAAATALLVAPVAYHRMVFRQNRKAELVRTASRLATAGLTAMGLAMVGAVFVVMDVVVGLGAAIAAAAAVAIMCAALWYVLPLRHRRKTSS
jgi:O-antigen/teichoic acid export membrane protein